jgi:hypothetical protein
MTHRVYNQQLGKGTGMINETLLLLELCEEGTTKESLLKQVIDSNILSTSSETRARDIVRTVFYNRFMKDNAKVCLWLKRARSRGLSVNHLSQLLYIFCVRQNDILREFIETELNPTTDSFIEALPKDAFIKFVKNLAINNLVDWSDASIKKNASYIKASLCDFQIIDNNNNILKPAVNDFTALFLMHELHFSGLSDMAIWNHDDWKLFNLSKSDVLRIILDLSLKGGYIAQSSGELLTISWQYKTMEEMIDATL